MCIYVYIYIYIFFYWGGFICRSFAGLVWMCVRTCRTMSRVYTDLH